MPTASLNALSHASSSYLRTAMHQPIRWHEWGGEAFAEARRENKPILLDIGAVWCHWCHVMDRESYEDPEIAQIINERFVAIKVDRDERPDVDSRYQVAVQAISGQGGWPLTAFLTPDGKPFYGGTYFPPSDHYGRPSFRRVLVSISDAYREKNGDVTEQAKLVEAAIAHSESFSSKSGDFSPRVIQEIIDSALKMFDERNGGFGGAPKFPHPSMTDLLIDQYARSGDDRLKNIITVTLEKMARGGVYDQLAGGFHRYSVDERWIVPHFEKMSYDNSELLKNYVRAYQATNDAFFAEVARDIIRWMDEWLSDRERGGFYASQDADISLDDDGDYFTWTVGEARSVLSDEEAEVACLHYDINDVGEMHHNSAKNVLYQRASLEEIAARLKLSSEQVLGLQQSAKQKMYAARLRRPTPYIDKTVYVSWNSLAISSYLLAARVLGLNDAQHFALRSLDRILAEAWNEAAGLQHVVAYSGPNASRRENIGYLDDYAFTAIACLDAYEATSDFTYFKIGRKIADQMVERFYDSVSGGFFDSSASGEKLGVLGTVRKPFQDSPTPAGNSIAVISLLRLHAYTEDPDYRNKAEQTLELPAGAAGQYGLFAASYGIAAVHFAYPHEQIVIVGDDAIAAELYRQAISSELSGRTVLKLNPAQASAANLPPALARTIPQFSSQGRSAAILCSGFSCKPPVYSPEELKKSLAAAQSAA
jgi:uncharacterized protein YyaL (SSP411 family)